MVEFSIISSKYFNSNIFSNFAAEIKGCSNRAEIIPNEPGTGNAV